MQIERTRRVRVYENMTEEVFFFMKAVRTHVGRCDRCGEPAAYMQILSGGRSFRFCEQHAPLIVKKQAEAAESVGKEEKK